MKVVHRDESTLILRPNDLWVEILKVLIFGTLFIMMIRASNIKSLTCNRVQQNQIQCQLRSTLFGSELENETLKNLREARLEVNHGRYSDSYYIIIVAGGIRRSLTCGDLSASACEQAVEDINTFIQSPNLSNLEVSPKIPVYFWLIPIFFLAVLLSIIRDVQEHLITWTFDRSQGIVTHRQKTLFGGKTTEYPLSDITGAQIFTKLGRRNTVMCRIELLTREGENLPLTSWYTSGDSTRYAAYVLREFLQLNTLPLFKN